LGYKYLRKIQDKKLYLPVKKITTNFFFIYTHIKMSVGPNRIDTTHIFGKTS